MNSGPRIGPLSSGGKMKKAFVLLIALLIAFALVGCNIAPNVPIVSPYVSGGAYGNRTPSYKNPANAPLANSSPNPADKVVLPGAGSR